MKKEEQKEKADKKGLVRSVDEFNKRFYPKPSQSEGSELPEPEDIADKLVKESLCRLQAALSSK
jgi:hypothetical protein